MNITGLNNYYLELWCNSCEQSLPLHLVYNGDEKMRREEYLKSKMRKLSRLTASEYRSETFQEKMFRSAKKASGMFLNASDENLSVVFSDEFRQCSREFLQSAKRFDSGLSQSDIAQAARNVWVINCLQVLFGYPVQLTPSAFAYSLLYPYCDNYLDNPSVSVAGKKAFNSKLSLRLKGESIKPSCQHEKKIYHLISLIEKEYPRDKYPAVYESLIAIHDAQCKSLKLLSNSAISDQEILSVSFEKGGTSVLADGYLVSGELSEVQKRFLYGLGIYLQVIDDLQDLEEDGNAELSTIFSRGADSGRLDNLTNRTLNFGREIIDETENFKSGNCFRDLITASTNLLVIEAACLSHKLYSKNYIKELESYSPFHFSFIKKYRKKYSSIRIPFEEIMRVVPSSA